MSDKKIIIAGLAIFFVLITFPFWINMGKAANAPELILAPTAQAAMDSGEGCVLPLDEMRANHMQILDLWRHSVVRNAERIYVGADGKEYNMSLSNTCLDCHSNKADFCDRCHNYASVTPYCWDCHIDNPKGE
ncbi:MAG: sulfate reduction electron transfer complex DsrMKJOP subunit DsrJ [Desulfobacteraceae bacterium]|nr:sulfate reduction electron transfer complex DsrMKJOP subunit DsrJ [Desulfobacteraceae bacterium]